MLSRAAIPYSTSRMDVASDKHLDKSVKASGSCPLRVLQVISVVAEIYGGPSTVAVEINRELLAMGVDARILCSSLNGAPGSTITNEELQRLDESGAAITLYRPSWPWQLQNSWAMILGIFRQVRGCDLVHIDGQYRVAHLAAYYAAKLWRVPYGVQPHGTLDPYFRRRSRLGKAAFNCLTFNRYIRDAKRIYFTAESEAQAAEDLVRADQVVVAPLGANLVAPRRSPTLDARIDGVGRNSIVLFLGRLAAKKRPDLLLEAWAIAKLPVNALLIVAGPSDDFSIRELEDLANQLGVGESVYFPGQVSGAEKSWLYGNCATFVLASENENFGLTVGEAMLSGCHVISSKGVAASSLLSASGSGEIVDVMTPESLASAIERALNDPMATDTSGETARKFATKHLGWAQFATVIKEIAELTRAETSEFRSKGLPGGWPSRQYATYLAKKVVPQENGGTPTSSEQV